MPAIARAAAMVVLLLAVTVLALPAPSVAQTNDPGAPTGPADGTPAPPPVPDPRVSPTLLGVAVDSPAYRDAVASYRDADSRLNAARSAFSDAEAELGQLADAQARLVGERNEATRERAKADARATVLRGAVRTFAVASYIDGGPGQSVAPDLDLDAANERARRRILADTVREQELAELATDVGEVQRMDAVLTQTANDLDDIGRRTADTEAARDGAQADGTRASADLDRATQAVADARLGATVVGLDFTFVVLDAYVKGAAAMAVERPACGLRWTALAGIGRTESGHGTYGGAVVQPDGEVSRPIVGIPLDGDNGTAVIADTDGGALDGDPNVDRAVGPMQFIPGSWRTLGRDGNGDGVADPQNMYDAALSAAALLCRRTGLDTDQGMHAAFLSYNNSEAYASLVLDRVHAYDAFVIPPVPG